jgi:hypothetical protein
MNFVYKSYSQLKPGDIITQGEDIKSSYFDVYLVLNKELISSSSPQINYFLKLLRMKDGSFDGTHGQAGTYLTTLKFDDA